MGVDSQNQLRRDISCILLPLQVSLTNAARCFASIVKGETSPQAAAQKHGLTVAEIEQEPVPPLLAAENAPRARPKDEEALKDEQIKRLKQKIGELVLDLDIPERGHEGPPVPRASERRVCRALGDRSPVLARIDSGPSTPEPRAHDPARGAHPAVPHVPAASAWLRFREGCRVTPKTVYRILALKGWFLHQRPVTPRPRAHGQISRADRSNERWATDVTHVFCGRDGLGVLGGGP